MAYLCPSCGACHDSMSCEDFKTLSRITHQQEEHNRQDQFNRVMNYECERHILEVAQKIIKNWDNLELRKRLEEAVKGYNNSSPLFG